MIVSHSSLRPAFSMITAIFMILLMASVAAFVMNLSGKIVQETTAQYRKEQAILLAKSYTEFAIMAATAQDCAPRGINASVGTTTAKTRQGEGYRIRVETRYIGRNSQCVNNRIRAGGDITTASSIDGTILIDVFVRYRNPEDSNALDDTTWVNDRRGITYHRRTLQRL